MKRSHGMLKDRLQREARLRGLSAVGFHKCFLEGAELEGQKTDLALGRRERG